MNFESVGDQSNCRDTDHVPDVERACRPYKGQQFDTLEEVHEFYNKYAKDAGFSVRINSSRKNNSDDIIRKEYVCFKKGKARKSKAVECKRRRGTIRDGCNAKLAMVKSKSGKYEVSLFVEQHNHALSTPRKVHLLRSHRSMSATHKCLSQQLDAVNIPPHQQISIFEVQAGGLENVGYVQSDLYNNRRNIRNELKGHDADMLYEHFQSEQEKNSSFYFTIKSGNDDRVSHCFWADAKCRRVYKFYNDVIVFDTTYNTNQYGMIFAPFVGVNNHYQTILLGCAFLSDETTSSFVWLFEQFKEAMPGDIPKMIITDQDPAMANAIFQVFPYTFHRFCIWHILNKISEKLTPIVYGEHFRQFQKCIWESYNTEDFDAVWNDIINKETLSDNEWLHGIYEIRSKWVLAYVNHVFSAGMSSSQRAESNHAFFKRCVSKQNSLFDFVFRFNRALARQRHEELIADNKDLIEKPMLRLPLQMEKQISEIYTKEIFYMFQDELWNSLDVVADLVRENDKFWVYNVADNKLSVAKVLEVVRDKNTNFISYICKKFEYEGIMCRHILAVFNVLNIKSLPDVYILKRWTKAAKFGRVMDDVGVEINDSSDKSLLLRRTKLFQRSSNVIDKAVTSDEASKILTNSLEVTLEKIKLIMGSCTSEGVSEKNSYIQKPYFNEPFEYF